MKWPEWFRFVNKFKKPGAHYPNCGKNYGRSSSINYNVFEIIIIDKQNRIIELFEGTTLPKDLKIREKIFPAIIKYFSNCRDFYEKFKLVEIDNINKNGNSYSDKVITFFSGDNKINCN